MSAYQGEEQRYITIFIINACKKQGTLHSYSEKKFLEENISVCALLHFSVSQAYSFM